MGKPAIKNDAIALFQTKYSEIKKLLGEKKAGRFLSAFYQLANDYNLKEATPKSLVDVALSVARLGLELDPNYKEVYVVPYSTNIKNKQTGQVSKYTKAQLIISAKGYKTLAARDGITIKSFVAYHTDKFSYKFNGWDESFIYEPNFAELENDNADWVWKNLNVAFAMAKLPNGEIISSFLGEKQILKRKNASQNPNGVWMNWAEEMIQKTIIKHLIKSLPRIEEDSILTKAIVAEDEIYDTEIVAEEEHNTKAIEDNMPKQEEVDINAMFNRAKNEQPAKSKSASNSQSQKATIRT
jgi:recombination protein RecT